MWLYWLFFLNLDLVFFIYLLQISYLSISKYLVNDIHKVYLSHNYCRLIFCISIYLEKYNLFFQYAAFLKISKLLLQKFYGCKLVVFKTLPVIIWEALEDHSFAGCVCEWYDWAKTQIFTSGEFFVEGKIKQFVNPISFLSNLTAIQQNSIVTRINWALYWFLKFFSMRNEPNYYSLSASHTR